MFERSNTSCGRCLNTSCSNSGFIRSNTSPPLRLRWRTVQFYSCAISKPRECSRQLRQCLSLPVPGWCSTPPSHFLSHTHSCSLTHTCTSQTALTDSALTREAHSLPAMSLAVSSLLAPPYLCPLPYNCLFSQPHTSRPTRPRSSIRHQQQHTDTSLPIPYHSTDKVAVTKP